MEKILQEQIREAAEKLGYIKGRNYLMEALMSEAKSQNNKKVVNFIYSFMQTHIDLDVEIR